MDRRFGRVVLEALVEAVFTGILAGLAIIVLGPRVADWTREPTCDNTSGLVRYAPSAISASSELRPDAVKNSTREITYVPQNLVDGDTGTSWAEGVPGFGAGQTVKLTFEHRVKVTLLCVVNGYTMTWDLYQRNARVRGLDVSTSDSRAENVTLQDDGTPDRPAVFQDVKLDLPATTTLTLKITSAYTSSGRDRYKDTCMSEIEIWGK
jgi:hypothetical protein